MEIPQDEKEILHELPVNGIVKKDGIRYITELDETKTRILDRYRIGKQMGKVVDKSWVPPQGGFAAVYELTSIQTGKKYAGKVVDKSGLVKPKMIENVHSVRESDV